jgi:hypothetical protein
MIETLLSPNTLPKVSEVKNAMIKLLNDKMIQ